MADIAAGTEWISIAIMSPMRIISEKRDLTTAIKVLTMSTVTTTSTGLGA
jgi:hypothetical protein